MLKALFAVLCFSLPALASDSLSGIFEGKPYSFRLDPTFNEVEGSWGSARYSLKVDSTFNEISGSVAGAGTRLRLDTTFRETQGDSPCGRISLKYDLTFREVSGVYCGQGFHQGFGRVEDVLPTYTYLVLDAVTGPFPAPARGRVSSFIRGRIRF